LCFRDGKFSSTMILCVQHFRARVETYTFNFIENIGDRPELYLTSLEDLLNISIQTK
jgi:hypothetical protein